MGRSPFQQQCAPDRLLSEPVESSAVVNARTARLRLLAAASALLACVVLPAARLAAEDGPGLRTVPTELSFDTPESSDQLLVLAAAPGGTWVDVTRRATYAIVAPELVAITDTGRVEPLRDGRTEIVVQHGGQATRVPVRVQGIAAPRPVSFSRDVSAILSKAGCNSGGCHGKAEGQGGLKLSVFGYDPVADHQALVLEGRGRRVFPAAADHSLMLLKATATIPHGGGQKIEPGSVWYRRLRRWIAEGAMPTGADDAEIIGLSVEPAEVALAAGGSQQLRVVARDAAGGVFGVTAEAEFQTNDEAVAAVDGEGLVLAAQAPGDAAILVRYLGHVAVCRVTRPHEAVEFVRPPEHNFVDRLVWDKLARLQIPPSDLADDATFLRRMFLDTIGTLPSAREVRRFLEDSSPDKRERWIQQVLDRPEYNVYWAQRWSDWLQADKDTLSPEGTVAFTRWIRERLADNTPYDQFVREILVARGGTFRESPAGFYQVQDDPGKAARAVSQLFLGVRIECAECHHHPFERWEQRDYFALAGFFTGVDRKPAGQGGSKIVTKPATDLVHPRTGAPVAAAPLGGKPVDFAAGEDRRIRLAAWLTSRDNPYFARAIANRIWSHCFGRGLVEPVDDLRETNPASNEPLLNALAAHLVELDFNLREFTRTLLASRAYQLSSTETPANRLDHQNYSHAPWKPLPAEVLLDATSQATGVPAEFNGWPRGYRAIQVWDNKLPSRFLEVFGRPARQTVCACERSSEPSMAQALHLMNSPELAGRVQHRDGLAARLAASELSGDLLIDELYLATLSRFPTAAERQMMSRVLRESPNRRVAVEDMLWTLLNTKEFVFNH